MSLTDLFSSTAQMNGNATAVLESIGGVKRALSYREADAIVDGIARQLTDIGLDAGQPVIISMHGCLEAPLTILGALRGGFIPCLLPISASVQQAATLMRLVKAKAVVTVGAVERLRPADMLRNAAVEFWRAAFHPRLRIQPSGRHDWTRQRASPLIRRG